MIVKGLELNFFRNYSHLEAAFDDRVNLIYGDNAQGKTNLLEAVAYLSAARSHRARYDREMIMLDIDSAFIRGEIFSRNRDFTLEARLFRGRGRQLYSNGVRLKTAGELAGILNTVLFCPEDLSLIRAGAAERRKFLDGAICQLRPRYAQALAEYNRLYDHKTRILRDWPENPSILETLDDFNLRMAQTGAIVIHYRAHFVKRLREHAPDIHADFSGGREGLELSYETVSTVTDSQAQPRELLPQLLEHQERHRQAEIDSRQCLSGLPKPPPPRDRPERRPCPSSWPSGRFFRRRPGSGPSFCWMTCCPSWTPSARPLSSTAFGAVRCSSPAAWRGI